MNPLDKYTQQFSAIAAAQREQDRIKELLAPSAAKLYMENEKKILDESRRMLGGSISNLITSQHLGQTIADSALSYFEDRKLQQMAEIAGILDHKKSVAALAQLDNSVATALAALHEQGNCVEAIVQKWRDQENAVGDACKKWRAQEEMVGYFKISGLGASTIADAAARQLLMPQFQSYASAAHALRIDAAQIGQVINGLEAPWARYDDFLGSAAGIAQLTALAQGVRKLEPFENTLNDLMRFELGDYRDRVIWKDIDLLNSGSRQKFYRDQGLQAGIADFSSTTIGECLEVELGPDLVQVASPFPISILLSAASAEEQVVQAFKCLRMIERYMRDRINQLMTKAYGEKWIKTHLKQDIREKWVDKQVTAVKNGKPKNPLIEYADFTDYELIITGDAAWREIFSIIYIHKEEVRVSFQRLNPVRVAVMHTRDLVIEDLLCLVLEGTRLMRK